MAAAATKDWEGKSQALTLPQYFCTESSILTSPSVDYKLTPTEIKEIQEKVVIIQKRIFEELKTELGTKGQVKLLDQNAFDKFWMSSPQFHQLVDQRMQVQQKFQKNEVIKHVEKLKPDTNLVYDHPDAGSRGCLINKVTGRSVRVLQTKYGPRGRDYSYPLFLEDFTDDYRSALKAEIAFVSGIELSSCVIL